MDSRQLSADIILSALASSDESPIDPG